MELYIRLTDFWEAVWPFFKYYNCHISDIKSLVSFLYCCESCRLNGHYQTYRLTVMFEWVLCNTKPCCRAGSAEAISQRVTALLWHDLQVISGQSASIRYIEHANPTAVDNVSWNMDKNYQKTAGAEIFIQLFLYMLSFCVAATTGALTDWKGPGHKLERLREEAKWIKNMHC